MPIDDVIVTSPAPIIAQIKQTGKTDAIIASSQTAIIAQVTQIGKVEVGTSASVVIDETARLLALQANTTANLALIEAQAAFNKANGAVQNAFVTINVAGQANVVADSNVDTLVLVGGYATSITTDAPNDTITIASTGDDYARAHSNAAFAEANTANTTAQAAFTQANIATSIAQGAFTYANTLVISVAGKTGVVSLNTNDIIENLSSNLWFTSARVRSNISNIAPINYDPIAGVISHASSGVLASGYGSPNTIPQLHVEADGHVTNVTNIAIAIDTSAIISGTLPIIRGGTGQTAVTVNGSLLIGNTISGGYDVNPLTAGLGIILTNDKGSITISTTGMAIDQFARDHANGAFTEANLAFALANTDNTTIQAAFNKANGAVQTGFVSVNVAGQNTIVAMTNVDRLFVVSGNGINVTTDNANNKLILSANISNVAPINYDSTNGIISHAASGVIATGYGDASHVPVFSVDTDGHIKTASNTTIALNASAIVSGVLPVSRGGTGQTAITTNGSLLIGNTISGGYDVNTLTPGAGIGINNAPGNITIGITIVDGGMF